MNGKLGLIEMIYAKIMDLAQRVGPFFGFLMGACYGIGYGYSWIKDGGSGNFRQMCFGFGFGMLAAGLGRALKKQTDIIVTSEAEKRIQNPVLSSESASPQIQREINKQIKEGEAHG